MLLLLCGKLTLWNMVSLFFFFEKKTQFLWSWHFKLLFNVKLQTSVGGVLHFFRCVPCLTSITTTQCYPHFIKSCQLPNYFIQVCRHRNIWMLQDTSLTEPEVDMGASEEEDHYLNFKIFEKLPAFPNPAFSMTDSPNLPLCLTAWADSRHISPCQSFLLDNFSHMYTFFDFISNNNDTESSESFHSQKTSTQKGI